METRVFKGLYRDPSIQTIPTLGPKACNQYLRGAIDPEPQATSNPYLHWAHFWLLPWVLGFRI